VKHNVKPGDIKTYTRIVTDADAATFDSGQVHPVYATFSLARDAEWCCRLFVLEMKEPHEEGIGTMISVHHLAPAKPGEEVVFTAMVQSIRANEIICSYEARVGTRIIARGEQGQKILSKEKIERIFASL
jgi:predicted thioesterase